MRDANRQAAAARPSLPALRGDAARLRRHPRPVADRHLHLRRRAAPSCNTTAAPSKSGAAPRSPARPTTNSPRTRTSSCSTARRPTRSLLAEVLASGQPVRDVERIVERADGRRVIVSINIDPLRDASGEVVGAVNCFLRHHRAQARRRRAGAFAPARARAGAAAGGDLRARRHRHFRARRPTAASCASTRRSAPSPATAASDLLAERAVPPHPSRRHRARPRRPSASRSPASWNSIRSRSASCARTAA